MCTNFLTKSKFFFSPKKTLNLPLSRSSSLLKIFLTFSPIQDNAPHWNKCISVKNNSRTFLLARRARNVRMFLENEKREREKEKQKAEGKSFVRTSSNLALSLLFFSLFRRGDHFSSWFFSLFFVDSPFPSPILLGIIMSNRFRWDFNEGEKIWKVCRGIFTRRIIFILKMNSSILNHRLTWQPFR